MFEMLLFAFMAIVLVTATGEWLLRLFSRQERSGRANLWLRRAAVLRWLMGLALLAWVVTALARVWL